MVVSDAVEFLTARGHRVADLTDYEIETMFASAFKNWLHDRIESGFYTALGQVAKPAELRDRLHAAVEHNPAAPHAAGQTLLEMFRAQGVPILN